MPINLGLKLAKRLAYPAFLAIFAWPFAALGAGADANPIPCECAVVVESQIPGPAMGGGGKILVNLSKAGAFSKGGFDVAKFHECQHNIGGRDEMQADAQGSELACKAGMLTEEAVQNLCGIFGPNYKSSTGRHPPGPVRCQTFRDALRKCQSGGGGSGGGGGGSGGGACGKGKPFASAPSMGGGSPQSSPDKPGQNPASTITRESPDEGNPFKSGNYEKEVAKQEAAESSPAKSSAPVSKGSSAPPLSDITRTASGGEAPTGSAHHGDADGTRRATASAGMSVSGGAGTGATLADATGPLAPNGPAADAKAAEKSIEYAGGKGTSGGSAKSAGGEIGESYDKGLSAPPVRLSSSDVAGALKDFIPAASNENTDAGPSLFERCRSALRRAQNGGRIR